MAMRNILSEKDSGLLKKSRPVTDFNKRLHTLLDDMRETLIDANGLGLAAPQVGVLRRVILVVDTSIGADETDDTVYNETGDSAPVSSVAPDSGVPSSRVAAQASNAASADFDDSDDSDDLTDSGVSYEEQIVELINPEIIAKSGAQSGSEGCLSVPGVYGLVTRPDFVKVKAQDRFGEPFEIWGKGLTARALCHEIDHLNGVIFTSLVERFLTEEEIQQMTEEREAVKGERREERGESREESGERETES